MKKNVFNMIVIFITIIAIILSTISIYAWHFYSSGINNLTLQITRIDSAIYVYQAIDTNFNGIPDMLSSFSQAEIDEIKENYPQNKKEYYEEDKAFRYIDYRYAVSVEMSDEQKIGYTISNMYPTMTSTLKMSVINNSDGNNWISFSFDSKEYTTSNLNLLRCLSVRVGYVINDSLDISHSPTEIRMSDKFYFNDGINTNFDGLEVIGGDESIEIKGIINRNENINDDVVDLWFQFVYEDYDSLVKHSNEDGAKAFNLTMEEYQALAGKTIELPELKVLLEVRI